MTIDYKPMTIQSLTDKFVFDLSDLIKREAMSAVTHALLPAKPTIEPAPIAKKKPGPKPGSKRVVKAPKMGTARKRVAKKGGK